MQSTPRQRGDVPRETEWGGGGEGGGAAVSLLPVGRCRSLGIHTIVTIHVKTVNIFCGLRAVSVPLRFDGEKNWQQCPQLFGRRKTVHRCLFIYGYVIFVEKCIPAATPANLSLPLPRDCFPPLSYLRC